MKFAPYILFTFLVTVSLVACKSDDGGNGGGGEAANCEVADAQTAQGNFRGADFVSQGGTYIEAPGNGNGFSCAIYVKNPTNTDCVFPLFAGTQDIILFSIDALEPQTLTLSEFGGATFLNFNRVVDNTSEIELATCGVLEITSYDEAAGELRGTVIAIGQENSVVNGSFVLSLCEF